MIIFSANKEWDRRLVKPSPLPIPLFNAVKSTLPSQIEHEQDGHRVIADEGEHVDKFSLTSEIPDREGDFRVSNGYSFLHKVHTCAKYQF